MTFGVINSALDFNTYHFEKQVAQNFQANKEINSVYIPGNMYECNLYFQYKTFSWEMLRSERNVS